MKLLLVLNLLILAANVQVSAMDIVKSCSNHHQGVPNTLSGQNERLLLPGRYIHRGYDPQDSARRSLGQ
jgi:hypothetical protein